MYVRPDGKKIEIHKKLLASISPELNKHVSKDPKNGIKNEREEVLTLFTEWAYTGDYARKDGTLFANTGNQKGPEGDPWPSLHKHLQLCVFSEKFYIPTLREFAESKFHIEIDPLEPKKKMDALGLVTVIGYAYRNLRCWDPILKFLAQYAAWKLELLREVAGFDNLILTKPDFSKELLMRLNGAKTKPITPQKHPTHNPHIYTQPQAGW